GDVEHVLVSLPCFVIPPARNHIAIGTHDDHVRPATGEHHLVPGPNLRQHRLAWQLDQVSGREHSTTHVSLPPAAYPCCDESRKATANCYAARTASDRHDAA